MKNKLVIIVLFLLLIPPFIVSYKFIASKNTAGAPPYAIEDLEPPETDPYAWLRDWKRPDGPPKVGLQVGHWKNSELPEELERLRGNSGSSGGGKAEWEVNLAIAKSTAEILKGKRIIVEVLPATIPPQFWADVFVAIHADGSTDSTKSGFKAANPRRDYTGRAPKLLELIEGEYELSTGFQKDPNVTRNMRGYYAFAWWRYQHAVHPMTASVILETGFLTSSLDRRIIVNRPEISAEGIANGIVRYLESENLLMN
ncbi:hypothetical protein A2715_02060 [Candidatus Woesebacteria bacterium RIFCSPHIGHO2_01_FULL_39_32]|uniref:Cell wall hydrolase/autolysin n=2 Tax=Candidatus Woeseibacteriota TaxID=1752722 RepID=A0A0G0PRK8_9BACT|nr:MAG: Cell wall hydrolase/autolysin [Candidatus Woesebacteria bacterium GW2011_GWA1_39_8]OGM03444.1 MAG: hypothetical protein A2124_02295 [Candidatus Woesebacteria bacterium GWB1_37_5]OGM23940.1 MAG: hypothetical protein A2715_02060 [Candidatus Woesebacteria bacterium RIFCSPHIGHO2_01_FULL_39_32]OGM37446.1 MAG: hypothetical protein A3F01_03295 [Candidatus Woesebacteria bacterium RIFCSPHIGHO2_12_FULL_38_11]OGM64129.1 MAG: hypothetical protein A2893_03300 [Candidatus Woesebacteria bacterium RIFC